MEIEDVNILAKEAYGKYRDKIYNQKSILIDKLIDLCIDNNFIVGKKESNVRETAHIIFFDLPGCKQISFHTDLWFKKVPDYDGEYDGLSNSTLIKLESAIKENYKEIIY